MPARTKSIPTQTEKINALIDEKGFKNFRIADWLEIRADQWSLMKGGYMAFPRKKAGQLAEILGVPVDYVCELFALESQEYYADVHR